MVYECAKEVVVWVRVWGVRKRGRLISVTISLSLLSSYFFLYTLSV